MGDLRSILSLAEVLGDGGRIERIVHKVFTERQLLSHTGRTLTGSVRWTGMADSTLWMIS